MIKERTLNMKDYKCYSMATAQFFENFNSKFRKFKKKSRGKFRKPHKFQLISEMGEIRAKRMKFEIQCIVNDMIFCRTHTMECVFVHRQINVLSIDKRAIPGCFI